MKSEMENDILKVLVTEEQLRARVVESGEILYDRFQRCIRDSHRGR